MSVVYQDIRTKIKTGYIVCMLYMATYIIINNKTYYCNISEEICVPYMKLSQLPNIYNIVYKYPAFYKTYTIQHEYHMFRI